MVYILVCYYGKIHWFLNVETTAFLGGSLLGHDILPTLYVVQIDLPIYIRDIAFMFRNNIGL